MARLSDKVFLVTGASRGLGAAVARRLAKEGAELLLIARDVNRLEALDDEIRALSPSATPATLIPFDLTHWKGLDQLALPLLEKYGRLDGLISCAAQVERLSPVAQGDPSEWEELLTLSVLANFGLIRVCDPLLRMAPHGKAIFVTCTPPSPAYWGATVTSKKALEAMASAYAEELKGTDVTVTLFDPGPMKTDLRKKAFPGESQNAEIHSLQDPAHVADRLVKLI